MRPAAPVPSLQRRAVAGAVLLLGLSAWVVVGQGGRATAWHSGACAASATSPSYVLAVPVGERLVCRDGSTARTP